jgi:hypothetical protein
MYKEIIENAWADLFGEIIETLKIKGERVVLRETQERIIKSLVKGDVNEIIVKRGCGASTAIYLFLVANLLCGKYKRIALVSYNEACKHFANGSIKHILPDISLTVNNKDELGLNGVIIEFIDKKSISIIKQFYDLIIFDSIDDCDNDFYLKKPYGISIYTSEKLMIEDELKSLNKIFLNKVNELIAAKEQINIAERKLKQYLNGKNVKR